MSTVNFALRGLAACYHKEGSDSWTIIFPTDDTHRIKFSYIKDGAKHPPIELGGKSVSFLSPFSKEPAEYEDASFRDFVLDLTGDYLYREGIKKNPTASGLGETKLEIKHATLRSLVPREGRLTYIFPFDTPDDIKLLKDKVGNPQLITMLVGGSIQLQDDKNVTIEIEGESPIELSAGDSFDIDNDCHLPTETNDFRLYQKIYSGKKTDLKFEAISIINPLSEGNHEESVSNLKKMNLERSLEESIIKIITSPPPHICDTVRISKPEGLD